MPSEDVLKMFYDYVKAVDVDTSEHDGLKTSLEQERQQNASLKQEIELARR